jgi:hypothetical protein
MQGRRAKSEPHDLSLQEDIEVHTLKKIKSNRPSHWFGIIYLLAVFYDQHVGRYEYNVEANRRRV